MTARNLENEFDVVKEDLIKLRADIASLSNALKNGTSETVRDQLRMFSGRVDQLSHEARARGRETLGEFTDHIENHPMTSILAALGIGLVIGRLLDR